MNRVFDKLFNSIVFRMGAMMFIISFVAIISMFSSVFISDIADKDALAINHAGSLRMQSYKILADFQSVHLLNENEAHAQKENLQKDIAQLEEKLGSPVINQPNLKSEGVELNSVLLKITNRWKNELSPLLHNLMQTEQLTATELTNLTNQFDVLVLEIDHLVSLYQQHAEDRIILIRMIQGISLFITVIMVVFIMFQLNRSVERPLSELTTSAKRIIAGDYTAHTKIMQNDELGFLSSTMNKMADAIAESHLQLEKRVKAKTTKLRQSNDSLELLFDTSQLLNASSDTLDLDPIVNRLSKITGLPDLDLCLMTEQASSPYHHLVTADKKLPAKCDVGDCGSCITDTVSCGTSFGANGAKESNILNIRYPLAKGDSHYGVLVCNMPMGESLEAWQHQLFKSISAQIATGLELRQQGEQARRFALTNERAVIARELHDSLAQALSYLKIQVTRLQMLQKKKAEQAQVDEVVVELKSGLSSAYRQLRELLTTFRLKIDDTGLQRTFEQTVKQLNDRSDGKIKFELEYLIGNLPLTPNEEIHLMQIAREATQNALNHSQGTYSKISLFEDEKKLVHLVVEDNGIGLPKDPTKLNHYGLAIIQERSSHLGGEMNISDNEGSGVKVELIYKPMYLRENKVQIAS